MPKTNAVNGEVRSLLMMAAEECELTGPVTTPERIEELFIKIGEMEGIKIKSPPRKILRKILTIEQLEDLIEELIRKG